MHGNHGLSLGETGDTFFIQGCSHINTRRGCDPLRWAGDRPSATVDEAWWQSMATMVCRLARRGDRSSSKGVVISARDEGLIICGGLGTGLRPLLAKRGGNPRPPWSVVWQDGVTVLHPSLSSSLHETSRPRRHKPWTRRDDHSLCRSRQKAPYTVTWRNGNEAWLDHAQYVSHMSRQPHTIHGHHGLSSSKTG